MEMGPKIQTDPKELSIKKKKYFWIIIDYEIDK
jgi:hypothetical protein